MTRFYEINVSDDDYTDEHDEYCNRIWDVTCVVCGKQESGSWERFDLENWRLDKVTVCPKLDSAHISYSMGRAEALVEDVELSESAAAIPCPF